MEQRTMVKRRWFWAWQDHKEEAWLQEMSQNGWHLRSMSLGTYEFEKGEPGDMVYRLDFRTESSSDFQEYLSLCEEAGWEYLGKLGSWRYFRKQVVEGETADLYTDPESKISKYQRILAVLTVLSPAFLVGIITTMDHYPTWLLVIVMTFYLSWIAIYALAMVKISRRIKQLKNL